MFVEHFKALPVSQYALSDPLGAARSLPPTLKHSQIELRARCCESGPCAPGQPCFCFGQTYCYQRLTITFPANPSFQLPAASVERVSLSKIPRQCLMWPQDIAEFQNQVPPEGCRARRIELNAVSQNYVDIFARTVVYSGSLFSNTHLSDAYIRAGAAFTVDIELIGERLMHCLLRRLAVSSGLQSGLLWRVYGYL